MTESCSTVTYIHVYRWLEAVLNISLPSATELESSLQNGVILCRLGMKFLPDDPMWNKVYDLDESKFKVCSPSYHTLSHCMTIYTSAS